MRALNTLLESCSEQPQLVAALEEVLFPLLHRMLSTEGQDVFEEVGGTRTGQGWQVGMLRTAKEGRGKRSK